jgi:hypothetical protein
MIPLATKSTALATVLMLATVMIQAAQAQTFHVIHTFNGTDGAGPSQA